MNTPVYTNITIHSGAVPIVLSTCITDLSATTVVFYPGTMAGVMYYRLLLDAFVQQGFNVVGVNPLSHGDSPRVKYLFTFEDIIQNGQDAVLWARKHTKGPVVIAGHSQGGIVALAHALHPIAPVDAAFLLCTVLPQHPRAIELTIFAPFAQWYKSLLRGISHLASWVPWLPIMVPMYLSLRKIFRDSSGMHRPRGHIRAFYPLGFIASLFAADLTGATRQGGITCPVSLITAQTDALFTPDLMSCMWDAIKASDKQRIVLTGGGHLAPFVPRYATEIAIHMAARCVALGLAIAPEPAAMSTT